MNNLLFKLFDSFALDKIPMKTYRTLITGYLLASIPLILDVVNSDVSGSQFWWKLALALGGGMLNSYFADKRPETEAAKRKAKEANQT